MPTSAIKGFLFRSYCTVLSRFQAQLKTCLMDVRIHHHHHPLFLKQMLPCYWRPRIREVIALKEADLAGRMTLTSDMTLNTGWCHPPTHRITTSVDAVWPNFLPSATSKMWAKLLPKTRKSKHTARISKEPFS